MYFTESFLFLFITFVSVRGSRTDAVTREDITFRGVTDVDKVLQLLESNITEVITSMIVKEENNRRFKNKTDINSRIASIQMSYQQNLAIKREGERSLKRNTLDCIEGLGIKSMFNETAEKDAHADIRKCANSETDVFNSWQSLHDYYAEMGRSLLRNFAIFTDTCPATKVNPNCRSQRTKLFSEEVAHFMNGYHRIQRYEIVEIKRILTSTCIEDATKKYFSLPLAYLKSLNDCVSHTRITMHE